MYCEEYTNREAIQVGVAYSMEDFGQVRTAWESLSSANGRMIPMYYLKAGSKEKDGKQEGMYKCNAREKEQK